MIQALIHQGSVQVREPIPPEWEGQLVKITTMTPDDPLPNLEERLAALHALGAMEFEPDEKDFIARSLAELNDAGKAAQAVSPQPHSFASSAPHFPALACRRIDGC